jgi:anti-sigma B factor antagonist
LARFDALGHNLSRDPSTRHIKAQGRVVQAWWLYMHSRDKYFSALVRAKATASYGGQDAVEVIRVDSTLDSHAAALIRSDFKRMIADGRAHAVIDLSNVASVDSAGLGSLVCALRAVREIGGCVRLVSSGGRVLQMLEKTALTRVFKVHASVHSALAAFAPAAA